MNNFSRVIIIAGFLMLYGWSFNCIGDGVYARYNEDGRINAISQTAQPTASLETKRNDSFACKDIYRQGGVTARQCVSEKVFLLGQPISAEYNQLPDATYRYGSTQRGKRQIHHGIDIKNNLDTPVLAAEDGIVVVASKDDVRAYGPTTDFYGQVVILRHDLASLPKPLYTLYGHLNRITVKVGQKVNRGQEIGTVGMGGVAIGIHLHFEVRYGENNYDSTRNPELWCVPVTINGGEKSGVLALRIMDGEGKPVQVAQIVLKKKEAQPGELPIYLNAYDDAIFNGDEEKLTNKSSFQANHINRDDLLQEDFAIGGLQGGKYLLSFTLNKVYNVEVDVFPATLTYIAIKIETKNL